MRIVPSTTTPTDAHLVGFMHELGCAPVVAKGTAPTILSRQLRLALDTPPSFQPSPIFVAYQRVTEAQERAMRAPQDTRPPTR
ncbi:MAG: hypothetical protein HC828_03230 [Blastochloris sp.]|nr:hypothetical protein [Blastochloris sp.]